MKLEKDKFYTIIDTDFEKLHIYPESGYTVWESYDPQSNRDWWCAIPTDDILDDIEKFVVESDGEAEFDADGLTDLLARNLENKKYSDIAIIHDESNDPYSAYYVDKDEVGEGGYRKAGYHLHLRGEDEDIVTSEEVCCYYLGGQKNITREQCILKTDSLSRQCLSMTSSLKPTKHTRNRR